MYGSGVDNVVVVEDQIEAFLIRPDLINQGRQDQLNRSRLRRTQHGQRALVDLGLDFLQRGNEVGSEERGVIVALIKRDPSRGPFASLGSRHPFRQQSGLARTSRR